MPIHPRNAVKTTGNLLQFQLVNIRDLDASAVLAALMNAAKRSKIGSHEFVTSSDIVGRFIRWQAVSESEGSIATAPKTTMWDEEFVSVELGLPISYRDGAVTVYDYNNKYGLGLAEAVFTHMRSVEGSECWNTDRITAQVIRRNRLWIVALLFMLVVSAVIMLSLRYGSNHVRF